MPQGTEVREQMPPGGSKHGGMFHKDAFNAYIFPKPGARRTERQETQTQNLHPEAKHQAAVFFSLAKEQHKPSRLSNCVDKHKEKVANRPRTFWDTAAELHAAKEKERLANPPPPTPPATPPPAPNPESINSQWNPHPVHLRGLMRMCKPRAIDWGVDLSKATGWECPFWDAPRERLAHVASIPGARPVTPTRSKRWRTAEDWDNPDMHCPYKLTQSLPKTSSMVELTRQKAADRVI